MSAAVQVGLVFPNGPELALALLCCLCQCTAAPFDLALPENEFEAAFLNNKLSQCDPN